MSMLALREWESTCAAIGAGRQVLLIRKGGIAEGSGEFTVDGRRFALLPTLFHQKHGQPRTEPYVVGVVCEVVRASEVPGDADLSSLAGFHVYEPEQLAARLRYKPQKPLTLLAVRALRLREPVVLDVNAVRAVCASWAEVAVGDSGAEAVGTELSVEALVDAMRKLEVAHVA